MIRSIIIDDEADGRDALHAAIKKYCPDVEVIGLYPSPEEGIDAIRKLKPSLVFLDVQMPHLSGFDVLQQLSPIDFDVIFVSAYDRYAIKAIKFSALDYLLKPVDIEELVHAIAKVKDRLPARNNDFQYQSVLNNVQVKSGRIEKIAVPTSTGIDFFNVDDIICCRADGSYTTVFLPNNKNCLVSKNLKDFENLLSDSGFCRVHHSSLINMKHVQKYIKGEGGYVILSDGHHVDISRRKKDEFLTLLAKL